MAPMSAKLIAACSVALWSAASGEGVGDLGCADAYFQAMQNCESMGENITHRCGPDCAGIAEHAVSRCDSASPTIYLKNVSEDLCKDMVYPIASGLAEPRACAEACANIDDKYAYMGWIGRNGTCYCSEDCDEYGSSAVGAQTYLFIQESKIARGAQDMVNQCTNPCLRQFMSYRIRCMQDASAATPSFCSPGCVLEAEMINGLCTNETLGGTPVKDTVASLSKYCSPCWINYNAVNAACMSNLTMACDSASSCAQALRAANETCTDEYWEDDAGTRISIRDTTIDPLYRSCSRCLQSYFKMGDACTGKTGYNKACSEPAGDCARWVRAARADCADEDDFIQFGPSGRVIIRDHLKQVVPENMCDDYETNQTNPTKRCIKIPRHVAERVAAGGRYRVSPCPN